MGDSLTKELLTGGAFEGETREFEPSEYPGVAQVARELHAHTRALPDGTDDPLSRLPRATDGEPMTKEQQTPIVESLKHNPNRVWHMDAFEKDGKYNCLRITNAGQVFLDVIKPGVHFSRVVQLAGEIPAEGITTLQKQLQGLTAIIDWEKKHSQGFLPEGVNEYYEGVKFDENGASKPGAVFVFDRAFDLKMTKITQRAILRWIGKHTNPSKAGEAFNVEDIFRFEWESLPTH